MSGRHAIPLHRWPTPGRLAVPASAPPVQAQAKFCPFFQVKPRDVAPHSTPNTIDSYWNRAPFVHKVRCWTLGALPAVQQLRRRETNQILFPPSLHGKQGSHERRRVNTSSQQGQSTDGFRKQNRVRRDLGLVSRLNLRQWNPLVLWPHVGPLTATVSPIRRWVSHLLGLQLERAAPED